MNQASPARRNLTLWLVLVGIVLVAVEGISALAFSLLTTNNPGKSLGDARRAVAAEIHARTGIEARAMAEEVDTLYRELIEFNPYRWYGLPASFPGEYFRTDKHGFRIDRSRVSPQTQKVAFYGGSTIFSVTTLAEHSIPAVVGGALDASVAQTLNFGVGGYSSSAELALFLETARRERLAVAIFYDGVNELGRYAESLQDDADGSYLDVFGYPFMDAYQSAARNTTTDGGLVVRYRPYFIRLLATLGVFGDKKNVSKRPSIDRLITPDNVTAHAERIVEQYLYNIADIAAVAEARGIRPVFFWQPDIYATRKPLTAYETDVRAEHPGMALLARTVRNQLQREQALRQYHFFDLSDTLDELGPDAHFFDYCHVSVEGNRHIGEAMITILKRIAPAEYWKSS